VDEEPITVLLVVAEFKPFAIDEVEEVADVEKDEDDEKLFKND
jgi:hypothetical protein